jgi:hypothetical protein
MYRTGFATKSLTGLRTREILRIKLVLMGVGRMKKVV